VRDGELVRAVAAASARVSGPRAHEAVCAGALALWSRARSAINSPILARAITSLRTSREDADRAAASLEAVRAIVDAPDGPGAVREALIDGSAAQSKAGLFYTPWRIAQAMAKLVLENAAQGSIIDPAAGAGVFGLALLEQGERIVLVERDALGATIAAACLLVEANRLGVACPRVFCADSIEPGPARDLVAEIGDVAASSLSLVGPFGAVIGNPPYGRAGCDRKDCGRPPNLAALFTLTYLDRLSERGALVFLLPRSLEFVEGWTAFRRALFDRAELFGVCPLGREIDVGMEQTVIALRRVAAPRESALPVLRLGARGFESDYDVPPSELARSDRPIAWFLSPACRRLLSKIEARSKPLADLRPRICRGLTVQRHLVPAHGGRRWITRSEIERYRITGTKGISPDAPPMFERRAQALRQPKIVAQRRVTRRVGPPARVVLKAAYDPDGRFDTADTVVNVFLPDRESALMTLAILNTELASYYLLARAFNGNAHTTPDLDRAYLSRLFIPELGKGDRKELARLAEQASEGALVGEKTSEVAREVEERLEVHFGLTREDFELVRGEPHP
jgi:hypothetical protein